MAADEALLESVPKWNRPVLRFYSWSEAAATFGYAQRFDEVAELTELRPLVRRPTGGGLVLHEHDWTYSLAFPRSHRWGGYRAAESYRAVHEWLQRSFEAIGVITELAERTPSEKAGVCFSRAERNDLLFGCVKLAGAAQRRNRNGLLIQGSIRPPYCGWVRTDWERAMLETGTSRIEWQPLQFEDEFMNRVRDLAENKYGSSGHNRSR